MTTCGECGAVVAADEWAAERHLAWHEEVLDEMWAQAGEYFRAVLSPRP